MTVSTPKIHEVKTADCLTIPSDSRGLLVGQTGSGKTYLGRVLIEDKLNLVIIDPKHDFVPTQEHIIVESADDLPRVARHTEGRAIVYRPSIQALGIDEIDVVFQWIFSRGNTFTYIDEITTIIPHAQRYPTYLRAIYTQGRGRGCGIISATQRPAGIPLFFLTEADRFWKFFLGNRDDQERMAQYMGKNVLEPADYPEHSAHEVPHSFYFYAAGQRTPTQLFILER